MSVYRKENKQGVPIGFDWPLLMIRASGIILFATSFGLVFTVANNYLQHQATQSVKANSEICDIADRVSIGAPDIPNNWSNYSYEYSEIDTRLGRLEREIHGLNWCIDRSFKIITLEGETHEKGNNHEYRRKSER